VLNKYILTITISRNFHGFTTLAVDDSLTLVLEDLPPLAVRTVDFQVS
jgi:hypothetical protein